MIAHSRLADVADAGLVIGVGNPTECITWIPFCGCDACDSGSDQELDHLDVHLAGVVSGTFRRLTKGSKVVTSIGATVCSTEGLSTREARHAETILTKPRGWNELSGTSWLHAAT